MSLDGFIAPKSVEDLMGQQWLELQAWILPQRFLRERLKLGEGWEEGGDNDIVRETFERTGASVMGKRMFDAGEQAWPDEAPFHTPVFVVTHTKRDPWERPGGTTFHCVNDGIEPALDRACEAAGDRDVRIAGGGATLTPCAQGSRAATPPSDPGARAGTWSPVGPSPPGTSLSPGGGLVFSRLRRL